MEMEIRLSSLFLSYLDLVVLVIRVWWTKSAKTTALPQVNGNFLTCPDEIRNLTVMSDGGP